MGCVLRVVSCLVYGVRSLSVVLSVVVCWLFVVRCLLFVDRCLMIAVRCSRVLVCYLLFAVYC